MAEMQPRSRRPSFLSSAALTWGTNIAVAILALVNVLIVARTLGPTGRGQVAFLTTIGTLVAYLANMGINQSNSNLGGTRPEARPALATNSVLFALLFGALGAGGVLALVAIFPGAGGDSSATLRWIALAGIPVVILETYLTNLLQAEYGFIVTNAAWLAGPFVNAATNGILAGLGHLTPKSAITAWAASWAVSVSVLVIAQARRAGFGRPSLPLARAMLWFGLKAHAGRILLVGNYRLDQWLVGTIAGSRELGLYSVAVAWSEGLFYLPTALVSVQRPDLVRATPQEAARQTTAVFRVAALITAFLAGALVLAAPLLCTTVFGSAFSGSTDMLRVLAIGGFGVVALKLFGQALTAQRKPMLETAAIAVAFCLGLALDLVLIPGHGGMGAAVAAAVAYSVGGLAVILIFGRAMGVRGGEFVPRRSDAALVRRLRPGRRPEIEAESP